MHNQKHGSIPNSKLPNIYQLETLSLDANKKKSLKFSGIMSLCPTKIRTPFEMTNSFIRHIAEATVRKKAHFNLTQEGFTSQFFNKSEL